MVWKCVRCGNTVSPNPPGGMGTTLVDHCTLCRTEADDNLIKVVKAVKAKGNRQTIANIAKVARIARVVRHKKRKT